MRELPLIAELLAKTTQDAILRVLRRRFGKVPPAVTKYLRAVMKEKKLKQLLRQAAVCPSIEAFWEFLLTRYS